MQYQYKKTAGLYYKNLAESIPEQPPSNHESLDSILLYRNISG